MTNYSSRAGQVDTIEPKSTTGPDGTTGAAGMKTVTPSFRVNNADGDACMLLTFNAVMKVKYATKNRGTLETTIPVTNTSSFEGNCESNHSLTLYYPTKSLWCGILIVFFDVTGSTTYMNYQAVGVRYIDPCFPPDVCNFNTEKGGRYHKSFDGTIGKSVQCHSVKCYSKSGNLTTILTDVLFQPFAQKSSVKGDYGQVETCPKTTPRPPSTKESPTPPSGTKSSSKAGMIAGIVIGVTVLAAVVIVTGVAAYLVWKHHSRKVAYGNF